MWFWGRKVMGKETYSEKWDLRVIRSSRKTIGLQIDGNCTLTVRAPYRMSDAAVRSFIQEKSAWIEKHMQMVRERQDAAEREPVEPLTMEEIRMLAAKAVEYIPQRAAVYAPQVNVSYGRITIRNQKSRWGSCSGRGNLNFNCLLMLTPPEVIDYVVVHELCHRLEMNHSPRFWAEVEKVLPDYRSRRKWLAENGNKIMRRMTGK